MLRNSFYIVKKMLPVLFCFFFTSIVSGQISITGAKCVVTALVYQYDIKGDRKENDKISICVDGGVFTETNTACIENAAVSFIKVQWNEGRNSGKITLNSKSGTTDISVNIATPFHPGFIETTDKQTISFNKLSPLLSCTQATGGNCSPSFSYQWEQSPDKLRWVEIRGATGTNLSFSTLLKQTTFFRRKVIESKSQTIGYSNEITVFVTPETKSNNLIPRL